MIKKAREAIGKLDWWQQLIVYWFGIGLLLVHVWVILASGLSFAGIINTAILMIIEAIVAFVVFMVDWEMTG